MVVFSAGCFLDRAAGRAHPARAADAARAAAVGYKAVILVLVGCNINYKKTFLANDA